MEIFSWLNKADSQQNGVELSACLFAFGISFPMPYSFYFFGFGVLLMLASTFMNWGINIKSIFSEKRLIPCWCLLALFVLGLISYTYAENPKEVMSTLFNAKAAWLIMPLVMLLCQPKVPMYRVMKAYIWGAFFSIILSLILVVVYVVRGDQLMAFFGSIWKGITMIFYDIMNRTYSGTNIVVALIFLLWLWYKKEIDKSVRAYYIFSAIVMVCFMLVNMSRSVILALIVVLCVAVVILLKNQKKYLLTGIAIIASLLCLISFTDNRLSATAKNMYSDFKDGTHLVDEPRVHVWKAVFEANHHHFFYGYGENMEANYLVPIYVKNGFGEGASCKLGAHNQYFTTYLDLGGIGLLFLIMLLVSAVVCTPKSYRRLSLLVVVLFAMVFMTETYAFRASGAMTFAFFITFIPGAEWTEEKLNLARIKWTSVYKILSLVSSLIIVSFCAVIYYYATQPYMWDRTMKWGGGKLSEVTGGYLTYRIDKSRVSGAWNGSAFSYHLFLITRQDKPQYMSVECYVSPKFNGTWAKISSEAADVSERSAAYYDMNRKGIWQTLTMPLPQGDNYVFFYVAKYGSWNFDDLEGYVLYRNPRIN